MLQAWKWENGYLYSKTIPRGEWRKCNADQTVEYLTECMREAAKIAFDVNAIKHNLDDSKVIVHTEENCVARDKILAMIGGE